MSGRLVADPVGRRPGQPSAAYLRESAAQQSGRQSTSLNVHGYAADDFPPRHGAGAGWLGGLGWPRRCVTSDVVTPDVVAPDVFVATGAAGAGRRPAPGARSGNPGRS